MTIRPFGLLDFPALPRYRRDIVPLDSARILTQGNPLGAAALLSYLRPRQHIYTAVFDEGEPSLLGQVTFRASDTFARLAFFSPARQSASAAPLFEHLAAQAGEWGALHLLAEVDESSPVFKSLRQAGFSVYAWQRVWKLPELEKTSPNSAWRPVEAVDWPAVQNLHGQIVPALLQTVEALPKQAEGLVCQAGMAVQAYVLVSSGLAGIWIWPLVHPDLTCVPDYFTRLVDSIPLRSGRAVHVCVRSYQAWLEAVLEDMGAESGSRQAVMVKHLAMAVKSPQTIPAVKRPAVSVQPSTVRGIEAKGEK